MAKPFRVVVLALLGSLMVGLLGVAFSMCSLRTPSTQLWDPPERRPARMVARRTAKRAVLHCTFPTRGGIRGRCVGNRPPPYNDRAVGRDS
jgi:hypothetical protein